MSRIFLAIAFFFSVSFPCIGQQNGQRYDDDDDHDEQKDSVNIQFKGTSFHFEKPDDFKLLPNEKGLYHPNTATSILVSELPDVSYLFYKEYFNADYFQKQAITLVDTSQFVLDNGEQAFVFKTSLVIETKAYTRYYIISGDLEKTVVFIINTLPVVEERMFEIITRKIIQLNFDEKDK